MKQISASLLYAYLLIVLISIFSFALRSQHRDYTAIHILGRAEQLLDKSPAMLLSKGWAKEFSHVCKPLGVLGIELLTPRKLVSCHLSLLAYFTVHFLPSCSILNYLYPREKFYSPVFNSSNFNDLHSTQPTLAHSSCHWKRNKNWS